MAAKGFLDWMPEEGSSWASEVDFINNFITYVSVFCTVAITLTMLWFAFRYRRRSDNDKTAYITHNSTLETVWTVVPTIICVFVFVVGFKIYKEMREPPANAMEINVTGRQWSWSYVYPNGKTADQDLVVPVNKPIKLILKSTDVNHSFFLPTMRVKEDLVKNEYHYLWFTPTKLGDSHIFCAEYCGKAHSGMRGTLKVVTEAAFQDYINDRKPEDLPPEELGKKLFAQKACATCHSLDGSRGVGPSLKGIFGRFEEIEGLGPVECDENYLRESILYSNKKIVKGYAPAMPAFEGQLKENEIDGLIAYMKTLK